MEIAASVFTTSLPSARPSFSNTCTTTTPSKLPSFQATSSAKKMLRRLSISNI